MTDEELKNKCTERAKIFQQAMESCHSSNPIDCIEWFADRIAELEKENAGLRARLNAINLLTPELQKASNLKTQQLTKAKKLLNMFLRLHYNPIVDEHTLFCKVEQFLKDSEVEK